MTALPTLTCNRFLNGSTFSGTKYGLYVEDGVLMNDIGGDPNQDPTKSPNANVFPTAGARPTQDKFTVNNQDGWDVPSDFVAVRFPVGSLTKYYAYRNEFVGNVEPDPVDNLALAQLDCYTTANQITSPDIDEVEVCATLNSNVVYFPLRVSSITSLNDALGTKAVIFPNPAESSISIKGLDKSIVNLTLVNTLGLEFHLPVAWSESENRVSVEGLPPGLYTMRLNGGVHKLIKK